MRRRALALAMMLATIGGACAPAAGGVREEPLADAGRSPEKPDDAESEPFDDAGRSSDELGDAEVESDSDGAERDAAPHGDAVPRLSELVESFFVPTCVAGRCHTTLAPAGDLSLTGRRVPVHEALVNAAASGAPARLLVVPGDPAASYLLEKLERDSPAAGTRMPPPPALLPRAQLGRLRAWIVAGANDD